MRPTPDHRLLLLVNGSEAATAKLKDFIHSEPHDSLDIGADKGSPVLSAQDEQPFVGLMESVKLSSE